MTDEQYKTTIRYLWHWRRWGADDSKYVKRNQELQAKGETPLPPDEPPAPPRGFQPYVGSNSSVPMYPGQDEALTVEAFIKSTGKDAHKVRAFLKKHPRNFTLAVASERYTETEWALVLSLAWAITRDLDLASKNGPIAV